jgi:hypothetical protein
MTSSKDKFAEYPRRVRNRTQDTSAVYELVDDRYAVNSAMRAEDSDESSIEVLEGKPESRAIGRVGPVYRLAPGGSLAIPTGLVFVRFKSGELVVDHIADIEKAGYEVARTIEYAPEAAWVRDGSNDIAKALNGVGELEKMAGVENVEPQMLMPRATR